MVRFVIELENPKTLYIKWRDEEMKGEGQEEKMKREEKKNSIWIHVCNKLLQYRYIIYIQGPTNNYFLIHNAIQVDVTVFICH